MSQTSPNATAEILGRAFASATHGRAAEAESLYEQAARAKPHHLFRVYWPLAHFGAPGEEWATPALKRADLHINYSQPHLAAQILHGIADASIRSQVLTGQARIAIATGKPNDALAFAAQARTAAPDSSYAAIIEGAAFLAAQRPADAIAPLTFAANARGAAWALLGLAHMLLGDFGRSAEAYRKALAFDSTDPGSANNLLPALMGGHEYAQAIAYADELLERGTARTSALAFKSVALAELDRQEELKALADFGLIESSPLAQPPGFADIAAFNQALAREIAAEPTLVYERNTTRFGYQTDDIGRAATPALRALNDAALNAARARANAMRGRDVTPFERLVPRDFQVYSWGVVMNARGHQAPHFHPHGWLSGVYYVEVPDDIAADDPEKRGWIEFGRGDERWHRPDTVMPSHQIFPQEGRLLTFPSYFWHNTRPLASSKRRISFAFDIIPLG